MQEIAYDALGENVARRSVPISEGTPEAQLLNDTFQYDAIGREVLHTTPWGPTLPTSYSGLQVTATDAAGQPTVTILDPLGRPVTVTDPTGAPTAYSYQPFGTLYTVTAPSNALTRTTRDAYGRVVQLDDPNRGTTTSVHDGFGELWSSTDALGRVVTYQYDGLGRTLSRLDQNGAEMLTTSWTWDTAPHGIGKLATLTSPDGTKSYGYTPLSQLQTITLDIDVTNSEPDRLVGSFTYDNLGRVRQITYPMPAGGAPFIIDQDRDTYGHVLTVRDDTTGTHYWHLADVDNAGRYKTESFGNSVSTTRTYFPDKQSLQSITTTSGTTAVQSLTYDYDDRLDLKSRSDALQPQNTTEWFRYDPVERLTCAYFNAVENNAAPCALTYGYDPTGNGNLTTKSDVGTLAYGDPKHPHAVTTAGTDAFGYDPVGNQTTRPGATIAYTPFDLPKIITQSTGAITFAYDGDEDRIRKNTPTEETLYFGDLYERDTLTGAPVAHRYYVRSPERVVAIVTVGGTTPGALYVHIDHLGSVDVLTDGSGNATEHRSYDPFGQRRNPVWGQQPPASFPSLTTEGYTGQESDPELGLVNMKGRVYDPKAGRFLTTDPLVSDPLSAQSWNAYSYVGNNPLNFTDPTGFDEEQVLVQIKTGTPPPPPKADAPKGSPSKPNAPQPPSGKRPDPDISQALAAGAAKPPKDVGTTGSGSGSVPQRVVVAGAGVVGLPLGAPGVPGIPLGAPGAPGVGPLNAPGPFGPNAFGPGSYIAPPPTAQVPSLPGTGPVQAPGPPTVPAKAPGVSIGGIVGGVVFILSMGMTFDGDAHPTLPPREYEIVRYDDKAPPNFENHHGVLDIWATHNVPGYRSRAGDSTSIRLTEDHHKATTKAYREWLKERTGKPVGAHVDWTQVSPREILELSERLFNAAEVPHAAREEYYRAVTRYFYKSGQ
jgi:RHS repeat-associated protein